MDRAFVLWMVIGVPAVLVLIGIVIVAAAFNLRAGYRGARVMLTVFAVPSFLFPFGVLTAVATAQAPAWFALVYLLPSAVIITATILMWRPDATAFFRAMSARPQP